MNIAISWTKGIDTAPQRGPFLVRSRKIPLGPVVDGWTYGIAERGTGARAGLWVGSVFWTFRGHPSAKLWEEWTHLP